MNSVVQVSKHLIPCERIAFFEPFVMPAEPPFISSKDFKARIVLLDKMSILSEDTADQLAENYDFRMIAPDQVATNPAVQFGVETFTPAENFQPTKPYRTRLTWRDGEGNSQSKLLLAEPETVLAVAARGEVEADVESNAASSAQATPGKAARKATRPRRRPAESEPT